jgi:serine O-acetyltransferase
VNLKGTSPGGLSAYVARQIGHFFPDGRSDTETAVARDLDETIFRLERCINAVRMWTPGEFYYLHSEQYAIFLYYLANTIWRNRSDEDLCAKVFFLNKALNGFSCFYDVELPEVFFIGHSPGIVLARATYGNYLVLYQGCTVGKNHGVAPVIGDRVVMYPHTAVIGRCRVGDGSVLSQGVSVINRNTPGESLVFSGAGGELVFKKTQRNIPADIFRL